jgi:hypothetical protein
MQDMKGMTMPAYKLNRGPRFGEVVHMPQSQEVHLATLLGDITPAEDTTPQPKAPEWGINKGAYGYMQITHRKPSGEVCIFDGHPDDAANGFKLRVWSGEKQAHILDGPEPPAEIIKQYKAQYTTRLYTNGGSMDAYQNAARKKDPEQ